VFLDLSYGPKPLGRLVIELYRDLVPVGADLLRNRCVGLGYFLVYMNLDDNCSEALDSEGTKERRIPDMPVRVDLLRNRWGYKETGARSQL
jgi:hypothetical protein